MFYSICNDAIEWQILESINVISHIFATALTVSEILSFKMFDRKNLGQGHIVQQLQWMSIIKLINVTSRILRQLSPFQIY